MLKENAKIKAYIYGNVHGIVINSRKLESRIYYSVLFRENYTVYGITLHVGIISCIATFGTSYFTSFLFGTCILNDNKR